LESTTEIGENVKWRYQTVEKISLHSLQLASSQQKKLNEKTLQTPKFCNITLIVQVKALKKCNDYVKKMKEAQETK
jgi:hypothetical protein